MLQQSLPLSEDAMCCCWVLISSMNLPKLKSQNYSSLAFHYVEGTCCSWYKILVFHWVPKWLYAGQVAFVLLCNTVLLMMIICCNKQEAVVQGPNGRDVLFELWLTTDLMFLFLCCRCPVLCLTWTSKKAGCSSPWCLWWDSPCLTTSHTLLPWWQP